MPRVTTSELHCEIEQVKKDINVIKDNHLAHLEATCVSLQNDVKDNRKYFDDRLNKLDNKIWTLVLLTLGTLAGTITGIMI
tara:strand:- start:103 stop:345 length:243 start_codon:yes stop_codon:yes gene_type:complete